jgi:hypothetical protein
MLFSKKGEDYEKYDSYSCAGYLLFFFRANGSLAG